MKQMANSAVNSSPNRREAERFTRRQLVLVAANKLLSENDIDDVSMDRIAAEVDYTRRTLYAYFKSRDEILLMVLTDDLTERWRLQHEAIESAETGLQKLIVWAETLYAYVRRRPVSIRLQIFWDSHGIDKNKISSDAFARFEAINNELAEGLREIFRKGVNDGSLRPDLHIDMTISHFLYSLRAIINRAMSDNYSFAQFDPDDYIRHYLDLVRRSVGRRFGGIQ